MKTLYPLHGIVTVLNTPFTRDNRIALDELRRNARIALDSGVSGFLVPAMASEVYKLTQPERMHMIMAVMEEVDGKVPVIAGAGETDIAKCKTLIRELVANGCNEILFQIPFRDEGQFYDDFMRLADTGPSMIMLQDWDFGGQGLPDELICKLFETVEAFRCLKVETVPAGVKYSRIIRLTQNRLNVSGGWAVGQMIEALERGVHAFMTTGMHPIYVRIYRDFIDGKRGEAEKLFNDILPVLAFSNQHLDISIHFFKRLLHRQGVYSTSAVRDPIMEFDKVHEAVADALIARVIAIENRLSSGRST